jgi:hypothetical protein
MIPPHDCRRAGSRRNKSVHFARAAELQYQIRDGAQEPGSKSLLGGEDRNRAARII